VLVATRVVTVDLSCRINTPAYMSVDGGNHINLQNGDKIKVYKSQRFTQLVRLSDRSFYHKISSKLISH
jgi:NAD kinase